MNLNLEANERDVLRQLFFKGPTWDGDICSKTGRDELFKQSFVNRYEGYNILTLDGLKLSLSYNFRKD